MAQKSKSGLSPHQREKFLSDCGFTYDRSGPGSHETWVHEDLKLLSQSRKIMPPANLLSNVAQKPWETTLCDDPGGGTWSSMIKHAEWCRDTVGEITAISKHEKRRCTVARQFRQASRDMRQWKKDIKNWMKAGLDPAQAPKAPMEWQDFAALKTEKNKLSSPAPAA